MHIAHRAARTIPAIGVWRTRVKLSRTRVLVVAAGRFDPVDSSARSRLPEVFTQIRV
jgi:hypothetical protein